MVHNNAVAQARTPPLNNESNTGDSPAPASPPSLRRPPGSQTAAGFGESVLQPWLRERKAQDLRSGQVSAPALRALVTQLLAAPMPDDFEPVSAAIRSLCRTLPSPLPPDLLHAVLDATRAAASRQPDFRAQCSVVYPVLQGLGEVTPDARGEQHLHRLLQAVLAFGETLPGSASLFAAWMEVVSLHVREESLMPFVLHALEAHPPRSAKALAAVAGHLALCALRESQDKTELIYAQMGQALSWLLRQEAPQRAAGLAGFGDGLWSSKYFSPRHLCELLQAIDAARTEIRDHKADTDIREMMDHVASATDWRGIHAQAALQSLAIRKEGSADPVPHDDAVCTVRGLFAATLAPGFSAQEVAERLPPWQDLLDLAVLGTDDLVASGRSLGEDLGGSEMAPAVLFAVVAGLAAQAGGTARAGAVLRGLVQAAGASEMDDKRLAAIASALALAPGGAGVPLVLTLAGAAGTLGPQCAQALPALRDRLERLLPAPLPATLRTGLALAADPLGALLHEVPAADHAACLEAAYSLPGLLDDAMVERQLWGCTLLAGTNLPLALQAARQLLLHGGARVTVAAFRELRTALLPQAAGHQPALADLYACFARHGRLDETAHAPSARKAGGKAGWQQRPHAGSRRTDAAVRFLREESALLGRGLARAAFEPLAQSLDTIASELASGTERKH